MAIKALELCFPAERRRFGGQLDEADADEAVAVEARRGRRPLPRVRARHAHRLRKDRGRQVFRLLRGEGLSGGPQPDVGELVLERGVAQDDVGTF